MEGWRIPWNFPIREVFWDNAVGLCDLDGLIVCARRDFTRLTVASVFSSQATGKPTWEWMIGIRLSAHDSNKKKLYISLWLFSFWKERELVVLCHHVSSLITGYIYYLMLDEWEYKWIKWENRTFKSGLLFFCLGGRTQFMEAGVVLREYWGKGWGPYNYNQMIPTLSCEAWKFNGSFSAIVFCDLSSNVVKGWISVKLGIKSIYGR